MTYLEDPKSENRAPGCVAVKLHCEPVLEDSRRRLSIFSPFVLSQDENLAEVTVRLTINFSAEQKILVPAGQRLGLPQGEATYGIKRGRLRFSLANCNMPLETIELFQAFMPSVEVEQQIDREISSSASQQGGIGVQGRTSFSQKSKLKEAQVKFVGSENEPAWIFEAQGPHSMLEGTLQKTSLGRLEPNMPLFQFKATLDVRSEDVYLSWGKIFWTQNIHRNKLAVIERALTVKYVRHQIEADPIMSEVSWSHG